ncbi:RTA1 domain-containing protein [Rhodotorula paludigena]|uniref:RTA1 domain-containing protein n=1 Tax=Rhodotorula paludigena TaxID=86838 RepID=UPI00317376FB
MSDDNRLDFNIYGYDPSLAAAIIFLVAFSLNTTVQLYRVCRSRIWWLSVLLFGGVAEIIGWVGRLWSSINVYRLEAFLIQTICLGLAPVFFSAAIYALLGVIIASIGPQYSLLRPRTYLLVFCTADLVSIVVQAVGGGMSATALATDTSPRTGSNVMVAGIAFQLFAMLVFSSLGVVVWLRARKDRSYRELDHPQKGNLSWLGWGLAWASLWIIVRGIYRTIELADGWTGHLIRNQPYFLVLDAAVMVLCQATFCFVWPNQSGAVYPRSHDNGSDDGLTTPASTSPKQEKLAV